MSVVLSNGVYLKLGFKTRVRFCLGSGVELWLGLC